VLYETKFFLMYPHLTDYEAFLSLCIGPLLVFYISYNTRPDFKIKPIHIVHLVPLIIYFILQIEFLTGSASYKINIAENNNWINIPNRIAAFRFKFSQLFVYLIICYTLLARHKKVIRELMSAVEEKELTWLKQFIWAAAALGLIWSASNEAMFIYNINLNFVFGAVLVLFAYWIFYQAISQQSIYQNINVKDVLPIIQKDPDSRYYNSPLKPC
jgi:hypothetical protein